MGISVPFHTLLRFRPKAETYPRATFETWVAGIAGSIILIGGALSSASQMICFFVFPVVIIAAIACMVMIPDGSIKAYMAVTDWAKIAFAVHMVAMVWLGFPETRYALVSAIMAGSFHAICWVREVRLINFKETDT